MVKYFLLVLINKKEHAGIVGQEHMYISQQAILPLGQRSFRLIRLLKSTPNCFPFFPQPIAVSVGWME